MGHLISSLNFHHLYICLFKHWFTKSMSFYDYTHVHCKQKFAGNFHEIFEVLTGQWLEGN